MQLFHKWMAFWERRLSRYGYWDHKLACLASICFGLILAKLFPQLITIDLWWLITAFMLLSILPLDKIFGPERPSNHRKVYKGRN